MLRLDISYRTLVITALILFAAWLVFQLWAIVVLVISAVIFMAALQPYVRWLNDHGLGRRTSVAVIAVVVLVVLGGLLYLVVPAVANEFVHLRDDLPSYGRSADNIAANLGLSSHLEQSARDVDWAGLVSGRVALSYGEQALFFALALFTVIVLTIYLLVDTPDLERFVFQFVPPGREPQVVEVLSSLGRVVGGYIRGQVITSGCIAVFTLVVCLVAGVPNPLAFALIAGIADIIPLVGAFLSVAPATAAGLRESSLQGISVLAALLLYQQFEDRFLVPRIYGRTLNLPPLIVLLTILAGGELLGVTGILLALPAAAAARVGIDHYVERRRAGSLVNALRGSDEILAPDASSGG